ncbi:MAG: tail fiber domain-containing protein [Alphaproteobacteria bacterium]|nr:tail fiber domain-containing protein [Alphaproteobacteria bacterium]
MAKSIGKVLGAGGANTSRYGAENEILNYLNSYDTGVADNTYKNMANLGNQISSRLNNRPGYIYSVSGSQEDAQRAENATYRNAVNKINPQFAAMRRQLETKLQNQGLSVGSEAYQNAMNSLDQQQAGAYEQAAYDSISAGQNTYTNSLNNQIAAGNFQNSAQILPVNEILSLLQNSKSGYDVAMDKYDIASQSDKRISDNRQYNNQAQTKAGWNALGSIVSMFSDENLKQNITEVGRLYNGLPVYLYNYVGDNTPRIGLLAQEVIYINPDAVYIDSSGYLKVNYGLACK